MCLDKSNYYYNKNLKELARRLRKNSTKAEVILWAQLLRGRKMQGYTYLLQRPVMNFIADFMCKELMLIIEIDGYTHPFEEQWKLDLEKQRKLENAGFTVIRFTDEEVLKDLENVRRSIEGWMMGQAINRVYN